MSYREQLRNKNKQKAEKPKAAEKPKPAPKSKPPKPAAKPASTPAPASTSTTPQTRLRRGFNTAGRIAKRTLLYGAIAGGAGGALGGIYAAYKIHDVSKTLPDIHALISAPPPQTTVILASDGKTELGHLFTEKRSSIDSATLPKYVTDAFVASENKDFWTDSGISYLRTARAIALYGVHKIKNDGIRPEGASTMTQQLVKDLTEDSKVSADRKIREWLLAQEITDTMPKQAILSEYLNRIDFGGVFGIDAASQEFFGKPAKEMVLGEAALLAAAIKAPYKQFSIRNNLENVIKRRDNHVLGQMLKDKLITQGQYDEAKAFVPVIVPHKADDNEPEIIDAVRRELSDKADFEQLKTGGYTIVTSIIADFQTAMRKSTKKLDQYYIDNKLMAPFRVMGPKDYPSSMPHGLTAYTGVPELNNVHVGKVVGTDDEKGTISVRVGKDKHGDDVVGILRMKDIRRYNPADLPPSKAAETGALLRITMPDKWPEADPKHPERPLPPLVLSLRDHGPEMAMVAVRINDAPTPPAGAFRSRAGQIVAIIGGYEKSYGTDRAFTPYQMGSSVKPYYDALAIKKGVTSPGSVLPVYDEHCKAYTPLTARKALWCSSNKGFEKIFADLTNPSDEVDGMFIDVGGSEKKHRGFYSGREEKIREVLDLEAKFGFTVKKTDPEKPQPLGAVTLKEDVKPDMSLALGTNTATVLQMAAAIGVLGREQGGYKYIAPTIVNKVFGPDGKELSLDRPTPQDVLDDPAAAWSTLDSMRGVLTDGTAHTTMGDFTRKVANGNAAGKTGTTNLPAPYDNQTGAAWISVVIPNKIAVSAVVSYDRYPDPKINGLAGLGAGLVSSGNKFSGPIMSDFLTETLQGRPMPEFPKPPGDVVQIPVDRETGHIYAAPDGDDGYTLEDPPPPQLIKKDIPLDDYISDATACDEGTVAPLKQAENPNVAVMTCKVKDVAKQYFKYPALCMNGAPTEQTSEDNPDITLMSCTVDLTPKEFFRTASLPRILSGKKNPPLPVTQTILPGTDSPTPQLPAVLVPAAPAP